MKWIVPIMGFREKHGRESGIERIWREVLRGHAGPDVCVVTPYEWWEDMRGLAAFVLRNSPTVPEVMVVAYSWGCGQGFARLAEEAATLGLKIKLAVLCDPVYRSRLLPPWLPLNLLSITTVFRPAIKVPVSVERVEWMRQYVSPPFGHDLVAEDTRRTHIGEGRYVKRPHTQIDDSDEFRVLVAHWTAVFLNSTGSKI